MIHVVTFHSSNIVKSVAPFLERVEFAPELKLHSFTEKDVADLRIDHPHLFSHPDGARTLGFGWYCWRPSIILKVLDTVPDDDVIFYHDCDAGKYKGYLAEVPYFRHAEDTLDHHHNYFFMPHDKFLQGHYTKKEVLIYFGQDFPEYHQEIHLQANYCIMRNNANAHALMQRWSDLCLTDDLCPRDIKIPQHDFFRAHRCVQSIITCMYHDHKRLADDNPQKHILKFATECSGRYFTNTIFK